MCFDAAHACSACEGGAIGERLIMCKKELFCKLGTRDDNHGHGPKTKEEDWPVFMCELGKVSM